RPTCRIGPKRRTGTRRSGRRATGKRTCPRTTDESTEAWGRLLDEFENDGVPLQRRHGLLHGVDALLPQGGEGLVQRVRVFRRRKEDFHRSFLLGFPNILDGEASVFWSPIFREHAVLQDVGL